VSSFANVPDYTYVSDILPSRFDENIVYATFNNLKADDFKPYVLKSVDKGRTWSSISANLPENGSVHTIAQDFVNENLLFVGTEFSFFFSVDGGSVWKKLSKGMPDIAVRDIALQERENDIVIATFGRGFYILDDYAPLRELSESFFEKEAFLFTVADALMYVQTGSRYGQGSMPYYGENPEFGAAITYYAKEIPKTKKEERLKKEKELFENGEKIPQPTVAELKAEKRQQKPYFLFTIKDEAGNIVKEIFKSAKKGVNRLTWNLEYNGFNSINVDEFKPTNNKNESGFPVLPGKYSVSMYQVFDGERKPLAGPVEFQAVTLKNTTLPAGNRNELVAFQKPTKRTYYCNEWCRRIYERNGKKNSICKANHSKYT
jgi:hypothetical protein